MTKTRTKDEGTTRQKGTRNKDTLKDLSPTAKQAKGVKGGSSNLNLSKRQAD